MNLENFLSVLEAELGNCCKRYFYPGSRVGEAAAYSLTGGGKRARASLIFLVGKLCGKDERRLVTYACSVEMVHCYSLIHDDLPCMDDDDMRRGRPSCHVRFGEADALLAGDALIGCAIQNIADCTFVCDKEKVQAINALSQAMGPMGMIYGQELDLKYENSPCDKDTLNIIHKHKTGRMISLCATLGSLGCDISRKQIRALKVFFDNVGLAFQVVDDILDVIGDRNKLGKPIGSDLQNNKSTFVSLYGLKEAENIARDFSEKARNALNDAFGDAAADLINYSSFLLKRDR